MLHEVVFAFHQRLIELPGLDEIGQAVRPHLDEQPQTRNQDGYHLVEWCAAWVVTLTAESYAHFPTSRMFSNEEQADLRERALYM